MPGTRDLPPLNALRAFEATSRLASVTAAAKELHVTHGAVSRQIRALEGALGQPLFVRQGRGLALTATGQQLRDSAGEAFAQLRDTWARLGRAASERPLVLGCPGSLLARWMIPRLERLRRDLPELRLHLSAQESAFEPGLRGLDAALLLAEPPWPGEWLVQELAPERIGPVLSPQCPAAARLQGRPPEALVGEPLLHTASRPQAWPQWAHAAGVAPGALRYGQGFEHLYYLLEAAVAGLGVAIAPQQLVADDLAAGRLRAPWGFMDTPASWVLATPRRVHDGRTDALAGWLREALDDSAG
ncbi:LysR family transcriptional regulator [Frateuria hangzhouensis]|uniref:LysR family transcriptional regulator n=1 Tax=Frateuria hangzhouensis TaxID=2995589 RepID=UPI002260990E|nr:LysR family transcriptional regulator [Frateuria sp. STR12]MCX7514826.1 LysR family transcriptional regulator [Frateuria sp. STR12]